MVTVGFHDPRYGVKLEPSFEIFRTYKGKEYRARAVQGFWHWNGTGYPTLNELNKAIGIAESGERVEGVVLRRRQRWSPPSV